MGIMKDAHHETGLDTFFWPLPTLKSPVFL